jgi:hypothetical protein
MANEAAETHRSFRAGRFVRSGGITLALAVSVGLLISVDANAAHHLITVELSCITGLTIWLTATALGILLGDRISRLPRFAALAARTALLGTSAVFAWMVMAAVAWRRGIDLGAQTLTLALTGGMTIAVGFAFYSFDVIRTRLERSVARLKEVEFAEKELWLARELQSRLLPPPEVSGPGWRAAARNLAANVVAGDFYDAFQLPGGKVALVVGDVAGKGMAAALVMASVKAMLPLIAADRSAADTLRELNRRLAAELPGREFVALAFALFDAASGRIELANAGLPDPYLLAAGAPPKPLGVPGPRLPLGVRGEVEYLSLQMTLAYGDCLLLLSDGLPEAPVAAGEPLGYPALARLLAADGGGGGSPLAWIDALLDRVRAATAPELEDDWTVLLVERATRQE